MKRWDVILQKALDKILQCDSMSLVGKYMISEVF